MCCNALIALPSISGENACISCFLTALPRNRRYGWRAGNCQGHCRGAIRSLRSTQPSCRGQCQYAPPPASVLLRSGGGVRDSGRVALRRGRHGSEDRQRSEEHTSELQSLMRISYAVFCLKKKKSKLHTRLHHINDSHL